LKQGNKCPTAVNIQTIAPVTRAVSDQAEMMPPLRPKIRLELDASQSFAADTQKPLW
jgi:hypothetical protein